MMPTREPYQIPRRTTWWTRPSEWLKVNGLNLLLALLALYVFKVKIEISFGGKSTSEASLVSWNIGSTDETATTITTKEVTSDLLTFEGAPITENEKPKPATTSSVLPTTADANLANNFNNLTFLLNPSLAKSKGIPDEVVRIKREKCMSYVQKYAEIAQAEKKKFGIPASIILAQGLLESNAGESRLTRNNQNHFGIKCFSRHCKSGHCSNFTDDTHKDFFRKYTSAWASFREHSVFLQQSRYAKLHNYSSHDYRAWAVGLKSCGYATDPKYAQKLVAIIEGLQLHRYDEEAK